MYEILKDPAAFDNLICLIIAVGVAVAMIIGARRGM